MKCINLRKKAINGLNSCTIDRKTIAKKTGLGYEWLNKLAQGKIPDPGVMKIEKVFVMYCVLLSELEEAQ